MAFSFVAGRKLDEGDDIALFVRAHGVLDRWAWASHDRAPELALPAEFPSVREGPQFLDLEHLPEYDQLSGRVLVRWGNGTLKWSQRVYRQPKDVVELRLSAAEPPSRASRTSARPSRTFWSSPRR